MLNKLIYTVTHAYHLGKKSATHATKYSPHCVPEFVLACDDYCNYLPIEETKPDYGGVLILNFVEVWRKTFELGIEEIRRERILVEEPIRSTSTLVKKSRVSKNKGKYKVVEEGIEWV